MCDVLCLDFHCPSSSSTLCFLPGGARLLNCHLHVFCPVRVTCVQHCLVRVQQDSYHCPIGPGVVRTITPERPAGSTPASHPTVRIHHPPLPYIFSFSFVVISVEVAQRLVTNRFDRIFFLFLARTDTRNQMRPTLTIPLSLTINTCPQPQVWPPTTKRSVTATTTATTLVSTLVVAGTETRTDTTVRPLGQSQPVATPAITSVERATRRRLVGRFSWGMRCCSVVAPSCTWRCFIFYPRFKVRS
jgi:hypothetical protein